MALGKEVLQGFDMNVWIIHLAVSFTDSVSSKTPLSRGSSVLVLMLILESFIGRASILWTAGAEKYEVAGSE